jgi:thiamine pyrophosphokinase
MLHQMIREETKHPNLRLWLFSECSLSFILRSQRNVIHRLQSSGLFTENVGLLPVWGPATISTTGLEWDVKNWYTHMGGQLSTSNHVKADEIHVDRACAAIDVRLFGPVRSHRRKRWITWTATVSFRLS